MQVYTERFVHMRISRKSSFCWHFCGIVIFFFLVLHRFEKLDITPKSAQKIKPVLERWMSEAEERYKNGVQNLTEFIGSEPSKKRKRRTSFTPQALEVLNQYFERNTHPSGNPLLSILVILLSTPCLVIFFLWFSVPHCLFLKALSKLDWQN